MAERTVHIALQASHPCHTKTEKANYMILMSAGVQLSDKH